MAESGGEYSGAGRVAGEEVGNAECITHTPAPFSPLTPSSSLGGLPEEGCFVLFCPFSHPDLHRREREQKCMGAEKPSLQFHADVRLGKEIMKPNCPLRTTLV